MKFFKKNRQPQTEGTWTAQLRLWINGRQREVADYLNSKTRFLGGKTLIFALILFCLVVGSYCLYLINSGL